MFLRDLKISITEWTVCMLAENIEGFLSTKLSVNYNSPQKKVE